MIKKIKLQSYASDKKSFNIKYIQIKLNQKLKRKFMVSFAVLNSVSKPAYNLKLLVK